MATACRAIAIIVDFVVPRAIAIVVDVVVRCAVAIIFVDFAVCRAVSIVVVNVVVRHAVAIVVIDVARRTVPVGNNDGGGIVRTGGLCGEEKQQTSLITVVGMKEANHFHTVVCFAMQELCGGKIYTNFANATASPPTCGMP